MTTHITKTWFDGEKIVTKEIPDSEKLHLEAATYAHERMARHTAGLIKLNQKPMTKLAHAGTWLAHYEGYKAGYQAHESQTKP